MVVSDGGNKYRDRRRSPTRLRCRGRERRDERVNTYTDANTQVGNQQPIVRRYDEGLAPLAAARA